MNPAANEMLRHLGTLRTASGIGALVVLLAWESCAPFFVFAGGTSRTMHGLRNIILGIVNALVVAVIFVVIWYGVSNWAEQKHFGILNWLKLPRGLHMAGAFLLLDCWMYWWHRLNHRVAFFWRFHRTHHSDPRMDVTTANRFHFGEIFFSSLLRIPLILLLGLHFSELVLYETAMFLVVQLHHANIGLPEKLDRFLRALIVTPYIHKVHHSRLNVETDSNYSSLFSFWDRLFRTLRLRGDPHSIQFGLDEFDEPEQQTLWGLFKTPLSGKKAVQKNKK
jgi:sterol desaturase/sphingolipid hydroxylase (fatty acid hydroxylase superfamily)